MKVSIIYITMNKISDFLSGKVAVVTGGTRGIGYAIVKTFVEAGAKVVLFGSRQETAQKALAQLYLELPELQNGQVDAMWPTITDAESVSEAFKEIVSKYGRIDILCNNAGISQRTPLYEYTIEEYDKIMDLNVKGTFICSQVAAAIMRTQHSGCIINTSSMVSIYGQKSGVMYPASKFAINGMTKSLARELGPDGIRVNAVAPGVVKTDMVDKLPENVIKPVIDNIPLARMASAQDIANTFLYLASDLASYVTGTVISVDGGVIN